MIYFLKKKLIDFLPTILLLILINDKVLIGHGSIVRAPPSDYEGANAATNGLTESNNKRQNGEIMKASALNLGEPTCEELRAMWQFTRRHSRASEITNEIPTYHDPFRMNVWDPYPYPTATRSMGGRRVSSRYRYGATGRPVYGRVVHQPSPQQQQMSLAGRYYDVPPALERNRPIYDDFIKPGPFGGDNSIFGGGSGQQQQNQQQQNAQNRRRLPKVRFGNGMAGGSQITGQPNLGSHAIFGSTGPNQIAPQRGSFQRLKELVWTERARELQQQRKSEEIAARAAILKDITNGQHYKTSLSSSSSPSSSATSRRPKTSGLNSNKNKLLKDESNGLNYNNNNKDDMQLVSHSSSYWPSPNENVKRSQQPQVLSSNSDSGGSNLFGNSDENEFNVKDYLNDMPSSSSQSDQSGSASDDGVMYDEDYDINGFFNSVNQDNINDFYFYINQLLSSKKSNQKSI